MARRKDITYYSDKVEGSNGNYHWPCKFDITNGYLGITSYEDEGSVERVLLSPKQVAALIRFVEG